MITIRVLCSGGDSKFEYSELQLEEATKKFCELHNNGYTMFSVDPETKDTKLVDQLFKTETQVIAIPQISGG